MRLLQSLTGPFRCPTCGSRRAPVSSSHGLGSPSTHEAWWSHSPGVYLTPYVALPGFLTLSAPCSPPDRPVLFHTGNVPGVSPFRAFPSRGAVPPLGGRCPPGVATPSSCHQPVVSCSQRTEVRCSLGTRRSCHRLDLRPARLAHAATVRPLTARPTRGAEALHLRHTGRRWVHRRGERDLPAGTGAETPVTCPPASFAAATWRRSVVGSSRTEVRSVPPRGPSIAPTPARHGPRPVPHRRGGVARPSRDARLLPWPAPCRNTAPAVTIHVRRSRDLAGEPFGVVRAEARAPPRGPLPVSVQGDTRLEPRGHAPPRWCATDGSVASASGMTCVVHPTRHVSRSSRPRRRPHAPLERTEPRDR